jgi:hypothetical protein
LDRKRPAGRLILAACALLLGGAGAAGLAGVHPARWLAPGADPVAALGSAYVECLTPPRDPEQAYLVEIGRTAFRTPMVLGGQAARAGIACESCHQGGRRNPDFFFPGLSGAPGTADVTSALFSSHRDDGIDNPRPIPDLGGPKSALKVAQDPASPALETFIHGLITQEFDGAEPPPTVLKGLAAYVRALDPAACPAKPRAPVRVAAYIEEARDAVRAAAAALDHHDAAAATLMLEGARWRLGLVDERYDAPASVGARAQLRAAALDLTADLAAIRAGDPKATERLNLWLARTPDWSAPLEREEHRSLFDTGRLAEAARGG